MLLKDHTLQAYLEELASRKPVPGGGSVAALVAALAVGLITMAAQYSIGRGAASVERRLRRVVERSEAIRSRLLELVDADAQAYLAVVAARQVSDPREKRKALRAAAAVPREVARLCQQAVALAPFLVERGNPHLVSDVEVAGELLLAAYRSAMINVAVNQS